MRLRLVTISMYEDISASRRTEGRGVYFDYFNSSDPTLIVVYVIIVGEH